MNVSHTPTTRPSTEICLIDQQSAAYHLDRQAVAYAQFDAQMTTQLQELELRFRDFWTPQAKKRELLATR